MKEKDISRVIILVAFAVIICLSRPIWFGIERFMDSTNSENRSLACRPKMSLSNYGSFPKEYTDYINDNLQFRKKLISTNSEIDYFIFNDSSSGEVTVGSEGYLFYTPENDGDPMADYLGTNLYTEDELAGIAQHCLAQRDHLQSMGKEYVIFIAPNKERIYSEYLPKEIGAPAENYRILQVVNYLRENTDLRVVYPYDNLMEAKNSISTTLYYKTDTHWNNVGGYVGAQALATELGVYMPSITDDWMETVTVFEMAGDLANCLNMYWQFVHSDYEYDVVGYEKHNVQQLEWSFYDTFVYHAEGADPRKIYVVRDSFSTGMAQYIGSQFNDSYLRHISTYTPEDLEEQNPDIVVFEVVERYLDRLGEFSFY